MRALKIQHSITRRDEKSLEKYLTEISRHDVLTPEQETAFFERINRGDEQALSKIVLHNLRFVVSVAKQYQNTGLWLGDLVNEGNIGLIKAAKRFDSTRGFKFISYAVWWIRQSIIQAINDKGRKIRLPTNHRSISTKITKEVVAFLQEKEREPSVAEIAELTGLSENKVQISQTNYKKCKSIDAALVEGEDVSLSSFLIDENVESPDHNLAILDSQKKQVALLLSKLSQKEASVLQLYFGIGQKHPMTLNDIGEYIGISRERVRQIKDKCIRKLQAKGRNLEPAI